MSPTRLSHDGSHESPGRDRSPSKYTDFSGGSGSTPGHHRFVITKPRGRPPNKKQPKPKFKHIHNTGDNGEQRKTDMNGSEETLVTKRDLGSQNTLCQGSEREEANTGDVAQEETEKRRRPVWNNSVKVVGTFHPKVNLRKYENELTFKPTITTKEEVYFAYTGHDTLGHVEANMGQEEDREYSPDSFEGDGSDRSRSNSGSPRRSQERILSKREARAYIKMTGVYGSDAFKNQRKQWFLEKLALAQDQKAKREEERRVADEKKKEEDRKKQQRQLNYVREKFRKEQVHRFRTQYVTSRVLEHEQANRHEYGLPEDFEDDNSPTRDSSGNSNLNEGTISQTAQNGATNSKNPYAASKENTVKSKDNASKVVQKMNEYQQRKNKENRRNFNNIQKNDNFYNSNSEQQDNKNNIDKETFNESQEQQNSLYAAFERKPRAKASKLPFDNKDSNMSSNVKRANEKYANGTNSNMASVKTNVNKNMEKSINGNGVRKYSNGKNNGADNKTKAQSQNANKNQTSIADGNNNYSQMNAKIENRLSDSTRNKSGSLNAADGTFNSNEQVRQSDSDTKKVNRSKRDNGPSLPHTKSHGDTENKVKKKKENPYIFKGHFRQEDDGAYHKLDTTQLQDRYNHDYENSNSLPESSDHDVYHKTLDHKSKSSKDESKANNPGESNVETPPSIEKQIVQNLMENGKINRKIDSKDSTAANQKKISRLTQNGKDLPSRNKRQQSSNTSKPEAKKLSEVVPSKPSAIALLSVLEKSKALEKPNDERYTPLVAQGPASSIHAQEAKTVAPIPISNNKPTQVSSRRSSNNGLSSKTNDHAVLERQNKLTSDNLSSSKAQDSKTAKQNVSDQQNQLASKHQNQHHPSVTAHNNDNRRGTISSNRSSVVALGPQKKRHGNAALADKMFDVNLGPSWNPHQKVPKMEGIDTVVIGTKDGKGHVVKQRKQVKNVVKEAENMLKVPIDGDAGKRPVSKKSRKMASPDVTLGSDFDVDDDDEEEAVGDIFERLRKKYNIQIDSDEEDDV